MTGVETVLLVIGILAFIVIVIRCKSGDPFAYCGKTRIYTED